MIRIGTLSLAVTAFTMIWVGIQSAAWSADVAAASKGRLNKAGIALCDDRDSKDDTDCYDPVSYFTNGTPAKIQTANRGKFRKTVDGATYVFNSQAHLDLFSRDPAKYLPQFGGWCAYAVADYKSKVDVDPKSFHIQNGRLLLFYDGFVTDTRKKWLTDKKKDPASYLTTADANWPETQTKEP